MKWLLYKYPLDEQAFTVNTTITVMNMPVFFLCAQLMHTACATADEQEESAVVDNNTPWEYVVRISKLEKQFSTRNDDEHGEWAGFIMLGNDPNRFWLTTKGSTQHGETDAAEIRLFYSRTIRPYVGVQLGLKHDLKPEPERDWLGFGLLVVMPYKIGVDASFFVGESGRTAARLEMAYKHWFTQKLSLTPDLEANFYGENDPERGIGSGLSDLDLGLRLRYQIFKGVSPYTGITWKGNFGNTADMIESQGEDANDLRLMLGVTLQI